MKKKLDYNAYGGAPLLGIRRPVIKAHGSSDGEAFFHALRQAKSCVDGRICETIIAALAARKANAVSEDA